MTPEEKERAYELLRSVALQAHDAIKAIRADNYGDGADLIEDCKLDLERLSGFYPDVEPS